VNFEPGFTERLQASWGMTYWARFSLREPGNLFVRRPESSHLSWDLDVSKYPSLCYVEGGVERVRVSVAVMRSVPVTREDLARHSRYVSQGLYDKPSPSDAGLCCVLGIHESVQHWDWKCVFHAEGATIGDRCMLGHGRHAWK
jgi:hypothetical protein